MIEILKWIQKCVGDNFWICLLWLVVLVIVLLFILILVASIRGNTVKLWRIVIEPSQKVKELSQAFKNLNKSFEDLSAESAQKAQWLKLHSKFINDILYIRSTITSPQEYNEYFERLLDFLFSATISILTSGKANTVRMAVFIPEGQVFKIWRGAGYSVEGTQKLRLTESSVLGQAFSSKKEIYEPDVTTSPWWVRNPKASREYHSLVCIPICINDICHGVLNADSEAIDGFGKDDLDGIRLIASNIALVLTLREILAEHTRGEGVISG